MMAVLPTARPLRTCSLCKNLQSTKFLKQEEVFWLNCPSPGKSRAAFASDPCGVFSSKKIYLKCFSSLQSDLLTIIQKYFMTNGGTGKGFSPWI